MKGEGVMSDELVKAMRADAVKLERTAMWLEASTSWEDQCDGREAWEMARQLRADADQLEGMSVG